MIIVWGERLCGRVNQVDNQVHVATRFFHVQYIPLLPLNSYIIINHTEADGQFEGVPIPLSWKSVLATYLRTILLIGSGAFLIRAFLMFNGEEQNATQLLALFNLMIGGFLAFGIWISYQLMRANEKDSQYLFQELRSVGYRV